MLDYLHYAILHVRTNGDIKTYMCMCIYANEVKDEGKTNNIGFQHGVSGKGVERMGIEKWGLGESNSSQSKIFV